MIVPARVRCIIYSVRMRAKLIVHGPRRLVLLVICGHWRCSVSSQPPYYASETTATYFSRSEGRNQLGQRCRAVLLSPDRFRQLDLSGSLSISRPPTQTPLSRLSLMFFNVLQYANIMVLGDPEIDMSRDVLLPSWLRCAFIFCDARCSARSPSIHQNYRV